MKRVYSLLFFTLLFSTLSFSQETMVLQGIYQGKDLYVKNPFAESGVGFCVVDVYVNGEITKDEINSSAFALDFNVHGIDVGTPVEIRINYKDGCEPMILNPEAIKPHSTFKVKEMSVEKNILTWTTTGESGSLPFVVQQFKWNKWVNVGEVRGEGTPEEHSYQFQLSPYSGTNRVRVRQVDFTGKPRYSQEVEYNPGASIVSFEPKKADSEIIFSSETQFEIFNEYGNLVKTGYGKTIDISSLQKGEYYLNYDSSFGETFKKK